MFVTHSLFRQIACACMGLALFLVAGGHLALLQGIAWTTMVHNFSRTVSLGEAVGKTFDGQHPCPLCKKIATASSTEEKAPLTVKAEKKAEGFIAQSGSELPLPVCRLWGYGPVPFVVMPERCDAPPGPVPRGLLS